VKNVTD